MMPGWLEAVTLGEIAVFVAFMVFLFGTLWKAVLWIRKLGRRVDDFLEDWQGAPARPGHPRVPGVVERLEKLEGVTEETNHNVKPNSGASAHDQLTRQLTVVEEKVDQQTSKLDVLGDRMDASDKDRAELWSMFESASGRTVTGPRPAPGPLE